MQKAPHHSCKLTVNHKQLWKNASLICSQKPETNGLNLRFMGETFYSLEAAAEKTLSPEIKSVQHVIITLKLELSEMLFRFCVELYRIGHLTDNNNHHNSNNNLIYIAVHAKSSSS